jgi:hypothetical protein
MGGAGRGRGCGDAKLALPSSSSESARAAREAALCSPLSLFLLNEARRREVLASIMVRAGAKPRRQASPHTRHNIYGRFLLCLTPCRSVPAFVTSGAVRFRLRLGCRSPAREMLVLLVTMTLNDLIICPVPHAAPGYPGTITVSRDSAVFVL